MKRNVCTKLTAVLLAAILIMPTQMIAHAEEYEAVDISPEMQTNLEDGTLWNEDNEPSEDPTGSGETEVQVIPGAENLEIAEDVSEEDFDLKAEESQPYGSSDYSAPSDGTVTIIHNEGYYVPEPEMNDDGLYAIDAYEDVENASGEIIPVVGYEITEDTAKGEELLGAGSYPAEFYPTVSTGISSQGGNDTCWAFSAMTSGERSLLTKGLADSVNLSEKHLLYGYYNRSGDVGIPATNYKWYNTKGSFYMAVAAMADLLGAADENKYPYTTDPLSPEEYTDDIAHLEDATFLANFPTASASWKSDLWNAVIEQIKGNVMENGAVWLSIYSVDKHSTTEWYTAWPTKTTTDDNGNTTVTYEDKPAADHAVTVVGWNDEKVIPGAENPGAFYVQNSWGANWGEGGYCWLSYEDASMNNPVAYRMEQSELGKTRDTEVFSHTGTGFCGKVLGSTNLTYGVNVFETDHYVAIDSIGFYTKNANQYEVALITDIPDPTDPMSGTVAASAQGTVSDSGFHRVNLDRSVTIEKGDTFAVKVQCKNDAGRYSVTFEGPVSNLRKTVCDPGTSYFYYKGNHYDCATTEKLSNQLISTDYRNICAYAYGNKVKELRISGDVSTATVGDTFALEAYMEDEQGTEIEVAPTWSSDTEGVTVSNEGLVTVTDSAVTGTVTIKAEYADQIGKYRFDAEVDASASEVSGLRLIGVPDTSFVIGPEDDTNIGGCGDVTRNSDGAPVLDYLIEETETAYYKIENFYTGLVMTLDEDDGMGNYYVIQDAWNGRDEQLWRILKAEGGYIIKNKKNGACLAIFDSEGEEYEFIVSNGTSTRTEAFWTITEKTADLSKAKMSVPVSAALINGKATVEPTLTYGYRTLVKGKEYSVSYSNNTKAGTATVTAKGIGYMTGSQKGTFTVVNSAASITSGKVYMIVPVRAPKTTLTVQKGSMLPNTNIYLSTPGTSEAQRFIFTKNSNGTYTITDQKSDFVAGIRNNSTANAAVIETQLDKGSKYQRWTLKKQSDGSYCILNAQTGKALYLIGGKTANGTNVGQYGYSGTLNQRFYLVQSSATAHTYSNTYTIRAAGKTSLALDIVNASKDGGANARIYTYSGGAAQKFRLMYSGNGYYRIMNVNSGKVLGIKGDTKTNGANVRQATWMATAGQRWKVVKNSDGSVTLQSALGTALDVYAGSMTPNANVDSWAVNKTTAQKWKLVKVS